MKVTKVVVKQFELDQKEHGTKLAIINLLWSVASIMLTDLGVNRVRTSWRKDK